jgi:hypothetical protein
MVSSSGVAGVRDAGEADAGDFGLQRNTGRLNKQMGLKLGVASLGLLGRTRTFATTRVISIQNNSGLPKNLPIRSVAG